MQEQLSRSGSFANIMNRVTKAGPMSGAIASPKAPTLGGSSLRFAPRPDRSGAPALLTAHLNDPELIRGSLKSKKT